MQRIFLKSISWSIVSAVFWESIKTKKVYFPDSKPLFILSVNNDKQEFVKNDLIEIYPEFYSCLENFWFDYE